MRGTYDVSDLELLSGGRHNELYETNKMLGCDERDDNSEGKPTKKVGDEEGKGKGGVEQAAEESKRGARKVSSSR